MHFIEGLAQPQLPYRICVGNHDILGLKQDTGKAWAVKQFGLDRQYYSFDRAGWHFIVPLGVLVGSLIGEPCASTAVGSLSKK